MREIVLRVAAAIWFLAAILWFALFFRMWLGH